MQYKLKCQAFSMLNISQVILMRTDSSLCRKELTVHWRAPNSLIRSYLQPCTNSMSGDESEAVAPIIWLYQIVDAQKEEVFFPNLLITLQSYVRKERPLWELPTWKNVADASGNCSYYHLTKFQFWNHLISSTQAFSMQRYNTSQEIGPCMHLVLCCIVAI